MNTKRKATRAASASKAVKTKARTGFKGAPTRKSGRQVEEALRENEQRLSSIYDTVGGNIFHLAVEAEGQYRFISVNPSFSRVTGLSQEQIVGKRVSEIIPEPSLSMVLKKNRQSIETKTIARWEETSDYPTGQLTGEVSVAPVFDAQGNCTIWLDQFMTSPSASAPNRNVKTKARCVGEVCTISPPF